MGCQAFGGLRTREALDLAEEDADEADGEEEVRALRLEQRDKQAKNAAR